MIHHVSLMFLGVIYKDVKMINLLLKQGVKPVHCCAKKNFRDTKYNLTEVDVPLWAVAMEMNDLRPLISLLSSDVSPQTPSYPLSRQTVSVHTELYSIDAYAMNTSSRNFRIASILHMSGLNGVVAHYYNLKAQIEEEMLDDDDEMTDNDVTDMTRFTSLISNPRSLDILARNVIRDCIHRRGGHVPTDVEQLSLGQPQVDLILCRDLLQFVH